MDCSVGTGPACSEAYTPVNLVDVKPRPGKFAVPDVARELSRSGGERQMFEAPRPTQQDPSWPREAAALARDSQEARHPERLKMIQHDTAFQDKMRHLVASLSPMYGPMVDLESTETMIPPLNFGGAGVPAVGGWNTPQGAGEQGRGRRHGASRQGGKSTITRAPRAGAQARRSQRNSDEELVSPSSACSAWLVLRALQQRRLDAERPLVCSGGARRPWVGVPPPTPVPVG